jgi:hypothetical protein
MKLLNWITEHELDLHSDDIGCVFGSPPCQGSKVSAPQPVPLTRRWNSLRSRASTACRPDVTLALSHNGKPRQHRLADRDRPIGDGDTSARRVAEGHAWLVRRARDAAWRQRFEQ